MHRAAAYGGSGKSRDHPIRIVICAAIHIGKADARTSPSNLLFA
jgi:hypothetical protein